MNITDERLTNYQKLGRIKNTWGFSFKINGSRTKFLIEKFDENYIVSITQMDLEEIFEDKVCLGRLISIEDLEDLFLSITRGSHLR